MSTGTLQSRGYRLSALLTGCDCSLTVRVLLTSLSSSTKAGPSFAHLDLARHTDRFCSTSASPRHTQRYRGDSISSYGDGQRRSQQCSWDTKDMICLAGCRPAVGSIRLWRRSVRTSLDQLCEASQLSNNKRPSLLHHMSRTAVSPTHAHLASMLVSEGRSATGMTRLSHHLRHALSLSST